MANVRIIDLVEEAAPSPNDVIPVDGASTRKATIAAAINSVAPVATQAEATAGTDNIKRMTPLSTKQAVDSFLSSSNIVKNKLDKDAALSDLTNKKLALATLQRSPTSTGGDDTVAFQAWESGLVQPGILAPDTYRVANTVDISGVDIRLEAGASLRDTGGNPWAGLVNGIAISGESASPLADRAYPGKGTRVISPSVMLVVDNVGADPIAGAYSQMQFWRRHYRGKVAGSSYQVVQNVEAFVAYGHGMTGGLKASGSMRVLGQRMEVYSADNGTSDKTELQAAAHVVRAKANNNIANGINWWIRETTGSGRVGSAPGDYDSYLAGDTLLVQKYTAGRTPAATAVSDVYNGAFGVVITTTPYPGGFQGSEMAAYPTYPLDSMLTLSGFTGPNGNTSYDGHSATATAAAAYAIKIGGGLGGIWTGPTARSRFDYGLYVTDCTIAGMFIDGAHPQKSAQFNAIHTTNNSGRVVFGVDVPGAASARMIVGTDEGATSNAVNLVGSTHATSERATINYNDKFVMGSDFQANGANLFGVIHVSSGRVPWFIDASGYMALLGLPTAANGDRIWRDSNGFLKTG